MLWLDLQLGDNCEFTINGIQWKRHDRVKLVYENRVQLIMAHNAKDLVVAAAYHWAMEDDVILNQSHGIWILCGQKICLILYLITSCVYGKAPINTRGGEINRCRLLCKMLDSSHIICATDMSNMKLRGVLRRKWQIALWWWMPDYSNHWVCLNSAPLLQSTTSSHSSAFAFECSVHTLKSNQQSMHRIKSTCVSFLFDFDSDRMERIRYTNSSELRWRAPSSDWKAGIKNSPA